MIRVREIVVIGGGGHAKVVISILKKIADFHIVGYTDLKDNGPILGVPHLGEDSNLADLRNKEAVLAIGQVGLGHRREELWNRIKDHSADLATIISPHAIMNDDVQVDGGAVVMDGAIVNSGTTIGQGAIINTGSIVEHDTTIDSWVHIAPGATLSGGVKIGRYCMVGAGAVVIEGRSIVNDCIVGAGAVVIHDLMEPGVYAGCPARRIR
jgi:sugar O-acyltransferase (sialic acid O-acetyltransferase NeuD family)